LTSRTRPWRDADHSWWSQGHRLWYCETSLKNRGEDVNSAYFIIDRLAVTSNA